MTVNLPTAFTTAYRAVSSHKGSTIQADTVKDITETQITIMVGDTNRASYYIAIGMC